MNVETFEIGEVAELQGLGKPFMFANGQDCEIVDCLHPRTIVDITGTTAVMSTYTIRYSGMCCAVFSGNLKKKTAHPNTVVAWQECDWQPTVEA